MTRNPPIVVRPRKASALSAVQEAQIANGQGMKDILHQWAEDAERLAKEQGKQS